MFLNYLKVFLRLFAGNRVFTLINLLGLSTGIACFILIRLYVLNETVYDKHIPDAGYTYRLGMKGDMSGFSFEAATMGGPFGRVVREEIPEVINSTTFYKLPGAVLLSRDENRFYEESVIYADTVFLDFFGFEVILGDPELMLKDPYSMVLSSEGAKKYFGDENPVGKTITWGNRRDYTVTGVIRESSSNSHLNFDILASYSSLLEQENYYNLLTTFYAFVTYNYIKTERFANPDTIESKIAGIVEKYMGEGMKEYGSHFEIFLQRLTDIHLESELVHELEPNGSRASVRIFAAISLLILLIACVNFVNLTTARSTNRIREIGVRKSAGAGRGNMFRQFLAESVMFAILSVVLAGILVESVSTVFYNFSGINPETFRFSRTEFYMVLLLFGILIGLISGIYPALYMSGLKPVWMLSGSAGSKPARKLFRNILVILQLGITLFLVFNTILISRQLSLVSKSDIGINKDDLLVLPMRDPSMFTHYATFKNELISLPYIEDVTAFSSYLGNFQSRRGFFVEGFEKNDLWMLHHIYVEPNYLEVMQARLRMGRNFREGSRADSNSVIINVAMQKQSGWDNPVGKKSITYTLRGHEWP